MRPLVRGEWRILVAALVLVLGTVSVVPARAVITTAIAVAGAIGSVGVGIDGAGRVVGYGFFDDGSGRLVSRGFTWQNGVTSTFGIAGSDVQPTGVSQSGLIVGTATDANSVVTGFLFDGVNFVATGDYPAAVNDSGQIVGRTLIGRGLHGFVSTGGVLSTLDVPGGSNTAPSSINASGAVVGQFQQSDGTYAGFSMVGGIVQPFSLPGTGGASLVAVNDSNQVIATVLQADGVTQDAYLFSAQGVTPIVVPGGTMATPLAINDSGMIVGTYRDADGNSRGFLDDNGVYTEINVPGSAYTVATGINASGQITGLTVDQQGAPLAFIATATEVTEPASWAGLIGGVLLVGGVRAVRGRPGAPPLGPTPRLRG